MESAHEHSAHVVFNRSYLLRLRLKLIVQAIGPMEDRKILCIGTLPSALRARLLTTGGDWTFSQELEPKLPYRDGVFDRVIIMDHLEWVEDDYGIVAEAHRVLKSAGLLFVDTEHRKRWTFWRPIRKLFGVEERPIQRVRAGYTERALFDILKDGFDIQETRSYSRFFVEGAETLLRLAVGAFAAGAPSDGVEEDEADDADELNQRIARIQTFAYPFFLIAAKLDWLIFFTRGYRIRAEARRRLWKPRRTPVLRDGRTLADATLNTRIGTAAPF